MPNRENARIAATVAAAFVIGAAALAWISGAGDSRTPLVVYCAHDSLYSEPILREFERRTGIPLSIRFDTEATKSLGLVELLLREKSRPRCDVFWNNELLGTLELHRAGVLEPYQGPGYQRIPSSQKDPQGSWTGFAARMRVWIVNTDHIPATPESVDKAFADDLKDMAMAKPLFGTTRTHYTVLWNSWGAERLKAWHADTRKRGITEVNGNAMVKDVVAAGSCHLGWTDTDDFFVAKDEGKPVDMLPVRVDGGKTITIPNTVAIIRGTSRPEEARQLVDYLLSAEVELKLANSPARQIPLGPVDEAALPDEVRQLCEWSQDAYPLADLEGAAAECLAWLKSEYVP